jgi:hypothetical protein
MEIFLIAAVAFLFAYPAVMRLALEIAKPQRERLLALSHALVYDPKVSDDDKRVVMMCTNDAWSPWISIQLAVWWPISWLRKLFRAPAESRRGIIDPRLGEFIYCWLISITAANPLFGAIVWLEFYAFLLVMKLKDGGDDTALNKVERTLQQAVLR